MKNAKKITFGLLLIIGLFLCVYLTINITSIFNEKTKYNLTNEIYTFYFDKYIYKKHNIYININYGKGSDDYEVKGYVVDKNERNDILSIVNKFAEINNKKVFVNLTTIDEKNKYCETIVPRSMK